MKRSNLVKINAILLISILILSFNLESEEGKTWHSSNKAKIFIENSTIIDFISSPYGIGWDDADELNGYFERAIEMGITGASITLASNSNNWEEFWKEYQIWKNTMEKSNNFVFVHQIEDIKRAEKIGKYAVIWNSQTSTILNGDIKKIKLLKEMGLTSMQLVHNKSNNSGGGVLSYYRGSDMGLSLLGKQIIDELVNQGIVVDLSHVGEKTCDEVIAYMQKNHQGIPIIYSHSLPHGLYKKEPGATAKGCYRNITDEQAISAAKTGGVVCPAFTEWMMDGIWQENINPQQCADMIDYYVKLIGIDHVGIASNDMFKEENSMAFVEDNPDAYDDDDYRVNAFMKGAVGSGELAKILPAITDELWKRGYSNKDIRKLYGENILRVYKEVWK